MKFILVIAIMFTSFSIQAQSKFNINEYGVYYLKDNKINKIPTKYWLDSPVKYKQYYVFGITDRSGNVIYNPMNNYVSEWFQDKFGPRSNAEIDIVEDKNELFVFIGFTKYVLDKKTLRTKSTVELNEFNRSTASYLKIQLSYPDFEVVANRTYRYLINQVKVDFSFSGRLNLDRYAFGLGLINEAEGFLFFNEDDWDGK